MSTIHDFRRIASVRKTFSTRLTWWQYPPDITLPSYLDSYRTKHWHRPDLNNPSVKWGDEISPYLETPPPIGSLSFNISHLKNPPAILLMPITPRDCLHLASNLNHYIPRIDTTVLMPILPWSYPHNSLWGPYRVYVHRYFYNPNSTYPLGIFLDLDSTTTSLSHMMWHFIMQTPLSHFPVTRVHSQFKVLS